MTDATVREIRIETPYLCFAARDWGPEEGHPLLALHGWLDNAASFEPLAPLLTGCRIVALDLTGHGLSDWRPPGVHYHFIDYIPDVVAAADALGWERFSLLGHSLGAAVASLVAGTVPKRVVRLALIEGLGPLTHRADENPVALVQAIAQMDRLHRKRLPLYHSFEEAVEARSRAGLSRSAAEILVRRGTRTVGEQVGWRTDPRLTFRSPLYLVEEQVLAFLNRILAPTLLINAEDGYLAQREHMIRRYRQVENLHIRWLPGGHHLHLEDPQPCARLLGPFLRQDF
ncbi:MAG: alpha/beta hydrolase [Candidatus Competibacteraceae bacterium]|nr:alpha/beta hydrolase [Candidatus Competibacteraceae bacterium]